jgi:hypothetical protein
MEESRQGVVAREGLRRSLSMWPFFRQALRVSYVVLPIWILLLVVDVPMTFQSIRGVRAAEPGWAYFLIGIDLASIVILALVLRGLWRFHSYLGSTMRVEAGMLTIARDGHDVLIALKEVAEAKINRHLFCNTVVGLRLKLHNGVEYLVPRGFERLDYVVDTLAAMNPQLALTPNWGMDRERVIALDHAMARVNDAFKNPARVFILYVGLPFLLSLIAGYYSPWVLGFWLIFAYWVGFALLSVIVGIVIRGALERKMVTELRAQLSANARNLRRELEREAQINFRIFVIHALILAVPVLVWILLVKVR